MKVKARHKLIPAITMLLVAAIMLSSASYAWFTMSKEVTATGISMTAVVPNNLLISNEVDGTYASTTDVSEITPYTDATLWPVSSVDGITFFESTALKSAKAGAPDAEVKIRDVTATGALPTTAPADAVYEGYWADYHVWIKTEKAGEQVPVSLSDILTVVNETKSNIAPSTRIAILDKDGNQFATDKSVYNIGGGTYFNAAATGADAVVGPIATGTGADAWKGAAAEALTGTTYKADGNVDVAGDKLFNATTTPTEVIIRVWFEGQDSACNDNTKGLAAELTVGFTGGDSETVTP